MGAFGEQLRLPPGRSTSQIVGKLETQAISDCQKSGEGALV